MIEVVRRCVPLRVIEIDDVLDASIALLRMTGQSWSNIFFLTSL